MEIIKLNGISVSYGENTVLDNYSLVLETGKLYIVEGPNGIGKTTLMKMLGLMRVPEMGNIEFMGKRLSNRRSVYDKVRKDNIGVISQDFALIYDSTVYENIALALQALKCNSQYIKERIDNIAGIMDITHLLKKYPSQLSGGECQKVAIARGIIKNPKLLLADEATASLDEASKNKFIDFITQYAGEGNTVVLATHENEYIRYAIGKNSHMNAVVVRISLN